MSDSHPEWLGGHARERGELSVQYSVQRTVYRSALLSLFTLVLYIFEYVNLRAPPHRPRHVLPNDEGWWRGEHSSPDGQLPKGMKERGGQWLREDICQLAGGSDVM